ncbi:hypothetical protein HDR63_03840 [bacterium]|nr:hypothetical protein [bacterium]
MPNPNHRLNSAEIPTKKSQVFNIFNPSAPAEFKRWFVCGIFALCVAPAWGVACTDASLSTQTTCEKNNGGGCYWDGSSCNTCTGGYTLSDPNDGRSGIGSCYKKESAGVGEKRTYNTNDANRIDIKCYSGAENKGSGTCVCLAYYEKNDASTACTPEIKSITLYANGGGTTFYVWAKYGVGFFASEDNAKNNTSVSASSLPTNLSAKTDGKDAKAWKSNFTVVENKSFEGFFTAYSGGTKVFDENGNFVVSEQTANKYLFETNRTYLYQQYTTNYKVKYEYGNQSSTKDCKKGSVHNTPTYASIKTYLTMDGLLFRGWVCGTNGTAVIDPDTTCNDVIQNYANTASTDLVITCKPKTEDCDAGYYCKDNTANKCPGGTTSATKSSLQSQCYISNQTRFCDAVGCFSLDDIKDGTVYYK